MIGISRFYILVFRPFLLGWLSKLIYFGKSISIGKEFRTDSIPRIIVDDGCVLSIGDRVEFRRNVEIRVHGNSKLSIENNVRIDRGVRILSTNNAKIQIGEGSRVGLYSVFNGGDSIHIGSSTLISGFVYIQTSMHRHQKNAIDIKDQGYDHAPIFLGNNVWLGTHVVVLPGVTISNGVVVGSSSVVTKSINEENCIVIGAPAKKLKLRE